MTYSVVRRDTASRYPQDAPYTATVTLAVPPGGVVGDYYVIRVAATDRGPLTVSGTGFVVLQDTKITPIAGERTDGQHVIGRPADGTESGFFTITVSGGAHDFLADVHLIHSDAGAITVTSVTSACARLGSLSTGASASMASGNSTTTAANQYAFWLGSVASTGAAAPGGSPGPNFPADIVTAAVPSGFTESGRTIDDVGEIALSGGMVVSSPTTATYTGNATVPIGDDYFGFGTTIIFDVLPLVLTGSTATFTSGSVTPHIAGGSVFATWNPSDKNAQAALSSGNTVMTSTSTTSSKTAAARSTLPITQKTRLQATLTTAAGAGLSLSFGLSDAAVAMNDSFDTGGVSNTAGIYTNAGGAAARVYENVSNRLWAADAVLSAMTSTTITVDFLVDPATRKCWIRPAGGSTYIGGGDPVAGTTPTFTLGGTGAIYACCADDQGAVVSGKNVLFNGDPSGYSGSAVSGYTDGLAQAGTSVALSGSSAAMMSGSVGPVRSAAIAGLAIAAAMGSIAPAIRPLLTGQAVTTASGAVTAAFRVPILGAEVATASGNVTLSSQILLAGSAAAFAAGTLTPAFEVPLGGTAAAFLAGIVAPALSAPLVGSVATTASGTIAPQFSVPIAGTDVASASGSVSLSTGVSVAIEGSEVTTQSGALLPVRTVPIFGSTMAAVSGSFVFGRPLPPILVSVTVTDIGTRCTTTVTDI